MVSLWRFLQWMISGGREQWRRMEAGGLGEPLIGPSSFSSVPSSANNVVETETATAAQAKALVAVQELSLIHI